MKTATGEYKSDFARHYFREGKAKGKAEGKAEGKVEGQINMVLAVLSARGVTVPDDARRRIVGCADLDQLVEWGRRATTAHSIHDVFD